MKNEQDDKTPGESWDISMYLGPALLQRVEALASRLSSPTRSATQAEVLRVLILAGLERTEKENAPN
jgi:hypothetical protein